MSNIKVLIFLLLIIFGFNLEGCKTKYRQQNIPEEITKPNTEQIFQSNQVMVKQNATLIRDQASKKGWKLTETGTGVFYQIIKPLANNQNKRIETGDGVVLTYRVGLIDGQECYSSNKQGLKRFVVEKSEAERGLHVAVKLMYPGDSALVVIPPHMAFGLTGDGDQIPPRAILVYEIRIDSVFRHQNK